MRFTLTAIAGCLALVLALSGTARADDPDCNTLPNPFIVNDGPGGPKALRVAAGFDCNNVALQIVTSLNIVTQKVDIEAASVLIQSANPGNPAQRIQMVNDLAASELRITAVTGGIEIHGASVKAHKVLKFVCLANMCPFTATQSDLIAATSFALPLGAGGTLSLEIKGPINITSTNVHGGDNLEMDSSQASLTLICGGTPFPCKDPLVPPIPKVILDACPPRAGDPPGALIHFPCNVRFQEAAELSSVCIGVPVVMCNGGHKEKRFTAFTFINVENSTIVADEHVTFTCKTGNFMGKGIVLDMDSVRIDCKGTIDISDGKITTPGATTIIGGTPTSCPNPAQPCINAAGAEIAANPLRITASGGNGRLIVCAGKFSTTGGAFPTFNQRPGPPYNNDTVATTAECAPDAGAIVCNAGGCTQL